MTERRTTHACPHCDGVSVFRRNGKRGDPDITPGSWRCQDCGARFDEPVLREPRQPQGDNVGGVSKAGQALLEMDPDDWPPREGSA